jgi:hypothetical protein
VAAQRLTPEKRERAASAVFVVASSQPAPARKDPLRIQLLTATAPPYWDTNQLKLHDTWKIALENASNDKTDYEKLTWKRYLDKNPSLSAELPTPTEGTKPSSKYAAQRFLANEASAVFNFATMRAHDDS